MARQIGAERLATGHYARIRRNDRLADESCWWRARDDSKDQSYFLWGLTQDQLARSEFPLGELSKDEVRASCRRWRTCPLRISRKHGAVFRSQRKLRSVYRGVFARARPPHYRTMRERLSPKTHRCRASQRRAQLHHWAAQGLGIRSRQAALTCSPLTARTTASLWETTNRCAPPPAKCKRLTGWRTRFQANLCALGEDPPQACPRRSHHNSAGCDAREHRL